MNTRPVINDSYGAISLSASFNQDASCFAVGLDDGFCVFTSDPCEIKVSRDFNAGIGQVEMLGRANYLALVGGGKHPKFPQNKVIIWDDNKQKVVITLEFRSFVHRVRLSKTRLVVALQNSVHIYTFSSTPEKISSFETSSNPMGLCCLGAQIIAFPGRTPGQVQLVEIGSGNVSIIPAHGAALRAMAISPNGEILATASETGTLVRIFSLANCARLAELRRGVDHALVYDIAISPDSTLLAVTSDKATLHVFALPTHKTSQRDPSPSPNRSESSSTAQKWGVLSKLPLLPRIFSDVYSLASAPFETDDTPVVYFGQPPADVIPGLAPPGATRPVKGVIGWWDERTVLVLGAGREGRWEKFILSEAAAAGAAAGESGYGASGNGVSENAGQRSLVRVGWKRYLGY